jgi:spore coat protein U-like protein
MNKQILKSTLIAAAGLLLANSALAASPATATFNVTATVLSSCNVTATDLAFGNYDPTAGNLDSTSTITTTCTAGTTYAIALGQGQNTNRQMKHASGSDLLDYELYQPGGYTTVWGDVGGATVAQTSTTGAPVDYTVNGRVTGGQYVTAGAYSDEVLVTVTY